MAASGDAHGTMIEVYPERTTLDIPKNDDQVVFGDNVSPPETWPFHVLLSVPLQPEQIEAIGAREGWRAKTFGRGMRGRKPFFHVIEFWLENRLMIEVVSPEMVARVRHSARFRKMHDEVIAEFRPRAEAALSFVDNAVKGQPRSRRRRVHDRGYRLLGRHGVHGRGRVRDGALAPSGSLGRPPQGNARLRAAL